MLDTESDAHILQHTLKSKLKLQISYRERLCHMDVMSISRCSDPQADGSAEWIPMH